jgi:L-lactate dehydrogenase complex protein LldE
MAVVGFVVRVFMMRNRIYHIVKFQLNCGAARKRCREPGRTAAAPRIRHNGRLDSTPTPRVALFATCLVDLIRPEIGLSTLDLLEQAGFEVVVPQAQTCCGQPGYNSGDRHAARRLAEKFLREFEGFDYIVIPSGSCAGMIKTHYQDLFSDAPDLNAAMERVAQRVYELTDFLANVAHFVPVAGPRRASLRITYHDSCSGLRELGVSAQPRMLLSQIDGVQLTEMVDCRACCGFGGAFAVKYGNISSAIVDSKLADIHQTGADAVVMGDLGCMLHMEGRLRRQGDLKTRVLHIAQVLTGEG